MSFLLARGDDIESPYQYTPTKAVCFIFLVLYSLSTLLHFGQALRYRLWFLLPTVVLGGMLEILGWSSRLWSSINVLNDTPFTIQITATIIGPTPLLAANFIILGRIIQILGPQYSRISPSLYSRIFLSCDIIALVVQGAGGGIASTANTNSGAQLGGNIMLGGIIFQLVMMFIFAILGTEVFFRYRSGRPARPSAQGPYAASRDHVGTRLKIMSAALAFNTLVLLIRAVYRTIELADGWNGRVISTQIYFNVLDGMMVTLAIWTLNFVHPGHFLRARSTDGDTVVDTSMADLRRAKNSGTSSILPQAV